tara:strand:+ start:1119 stop:2492 length:1374 start_codon:yes stop_codon:yes gene_type:complete
MIVKNNIQKIYYLFLFSHLIIWTLVPAISNINLPLDTIEALAWGSNLDWGFGKHPPLSAFFAELFFKLFGNQDWAFYLLSQIFVLTAFIAIFKLSNELFKNEILALISIFLLEGIYFYNFTSPEFNVNVSQLPFWALSLLFTWRCIKFNKIKDFIILGSLFALGVLSKYLFVYLIAAVYVLFFYYLFIEKKIRFFKIFVTGLVSVLLLLPHFFWLIENNFTTLFYGLKRTGGIGNLSDHLIYPALFMLKQIILLAPFFLLCLILLKKPKFKINFKSKNMIFIGCTVLGPIVLVFFTSFILGVKIRTMWMTPFYLGLGILIIEIFKKNINLKTIKKFYVIFISIFIFSPLAYLSLSLIDDTKRTDYPGKEIARLVQNKWDDNFSNEIKIVIGDEWSAGNLSYHLNSRPIWLNELKDKTINISNKEGVIYTGNPKILKKICPGVFGTIKPVGYCMIGKR